MTDKDLALSLTRPLLCPHSPNLVKMSVSGYFTITVCIMTLQVLSQVVHWDCFFMVVLGFS